MHSSLFLMPGAARVPFSPRYLPRAALCRVDRGRQGSMQLRGALGEHQAELWHSTAFGPGVTYQGSIGENITLQIILDESVPGGELMVRLDNRSCAHKHTVALQSYTYEWVQAQGEAQGCSRSDRLREDLRVDVSGRDHDILPMLSTFSAPSASSLTMFNSGSGLTLVIEKANKQRTHVVVEGVQLRKTLLQHPPSASASMVEWQWRRQTKGRGWKTAILRKKCAAPEPPEKSYSTTWNTSDRLNPCLIETSSANVIE
eukprot:CAMPEP_0179437858 /NCGR_PEP_ID=MMETSP0799-20121207/21671_1 /TAXON_ID=46947 /ORGANISM="Geminigera cryophila, Strain CCMP2564" /LENGTH=257 /DNA_ID=CAMNT_0021219055 /DNA_START=182 /DNA_END=955 /DNA_ORIENTATION=-